MQEARVSVSKYFRSTAIASRNPRKCSDTIDGITVRVFYTDNPHAILFRSRLRFCVARAHGTPLLSRRRTRRVKWIYGPRRKHEASRRFFVAQLIFHTSRPYYSYRRVLRNRLTFSINKTSANNVCCSLSLSLSI